MKNLMKNLALWRQKRDQQIAQVNHAKAKYQLTPEYKQWEMEKKLLDYQNGQIEALESYIKSVGYFQSSKSHFENRKPFPGIQVKEFTVVEVLDEKAAIKWAAKDLVDALSLKKSPFNKAMKVLNKEFVRIVKEYRPQIISKDLERYLEEG